MGRAPCCDKANVKKGPWSPEEDAKLKDFITKYGTAGNWIALPQKAGLKRCGKSCRLRWLNYLRPNIKHGEFSDEEDRIICSLYANIGSRWSIIAAQLPGRTDNDIKNYWNTKLKKKLVGNFIQSSYQPKSLAPFSFQQSQTTLSTLTHLYNSLYYPQPATKTIDPISTTPQSFLQFNTTPPLTTPTTSQIYPHEGLMDFQYCPMRANMLMFGGSEPSCSSSDGSYSKDHTKQEDTRCYYNNQGLMKFVIDDPYNVVLDQQSRKGIDDENNQLQYDVEQVITGNGSCNNMNMNGLLLMSDEQKRGETEVYYY